MCSCLVKPGWDATCSIVTASDNAARREVSQVAAAMRLNFNTFFTIPIFGWFRSTLSGTDAKQRRPIVEILAVVNIVDNKLYQVNDFTVILLISSLLKYCAHNGLWQVYLPLHNVLYFYCTVYERTYPCGMWDPGPIHNGWKECKTASPHTRYRTSLLTCSLDSDYMYHPWKPLNHQTLGAVLIRIF